MPFGDWQFWVVTAFALAALVVLVRSLRPKKRKPPRVSLTIERKKIP